MAHFIFLLLWIEISLHSATCLAEPARRGHAIFFVSIDDKVLIKECAITSQLRPDCPLRRGTQIIQKQIPDFKKVLKNAILSLVFHAESPINELQEIELKISENQVSNIDALTQFFCEVFEADGDCARIHPEIARLKTLKPMTRQGENSSELHQIINQLIEEAVSFKQTPLYRHSRAVDSLPYQILHNYISLRLPQMSFIKIAAGSFVMGSSVSESNRRGNENQVDVTIAQDFEIQETEITQLQWFTVLSTNPSRFSRKSSCPESYVEKNGTSMCPDLPVENITWTLLHDEFIPRLNDLDPDHTYRLPTYLLRAARRNIDIARVHFPSLGSRLVRMKKAPAPHA